MLQKIVTLAIGCLAVSNALQLEKCKDKDNTEPVFLDDAMDVAITMTETEAENPLLSGEVQEHLEEAIDAMIPVIAKGEEATEDQWEAVAAGVVEEIVDETVEAGGVEEMVENGEV